jgi:hypothetical protein
MRWLSVAEKGQGGEYLIRAPKQVENAPHLLTTLRGEAGSQASILLGFDFPIGLPWKYARQTGKARFLELLSRLGSPE